VNDESPALLVGGLPPPVMKLLTAAFLLYSSSTSRLFLFRMNKNSPPAITAMATMLTTTPTAMAALLGPLFDDSGVAEAVEDPEVPGAAVTTVVVPGAVITDGFVAVVSDAVVDVEDGADDEVDEPSAEAVEALAATPLNQKLQYELPPPVIMSVLIQYTLNYIPRTHILPITGARGIAKRVGN
jgi:hypothetical protein